jgi:cytochrome c oxidase assembly protein Cox11
MHPKLRNISYALAAIIIILLALQPYNRLCQYSGRCSQIYLSDLLPSREGTETITAFMEVLNYRSDLDFEVFEPRNLETVSGRKNTVTYRIKNLTDRTIKFRPQFSVQPKELEKYLVRSECLCFREHTLKKGEELILPTIFKFKSAISKDQVFKDNFREIRIIYSLKALPPKSRKR